MIFKRLLFIAIMLLPVVLEAQELNFDPKNRQLNFLKRNHFDPFYNAKNAQVNDYLSKVFQLRKRGNTFIASGGVLAFGFELSVLSPPVIITGYVISRKARKYLHMATEENLKILTNNQIYTGPEAFRQPKPRKWFKKKNYLIDYYDGGDPSINEHLINAWQNKRKSSRLLTASLGATVIGASMFIFSSLKLFEDTFDHEVSPHPLLLPGTLVGLGIYSLGI